MLNIGQPKCHICDSEVVVNKSCLKCHRAYCGEDASKINPALYCDGCMKDVSIEETTYTRTDTEYDEHTDTLNVKKHHSKDIIFKGIDWMFACHKICELPDEELKPILQYHKAFVTFLESELMVRNVKKAHAQVQMNHPAARRIQTTKTVTTKTVRKAKAQTQQLDINALVQLALKLGITSAEQLQEFMKSRVN